MESFRSSRGESSAVAQSSVTQLCFCSLPGSLGRRLLAREHRLFLKTLLSHLSHAVEPTSFADADAQLTVVDFESHAGDLLCYYHHGPGDKNRLKNQSLSF